MLSMLMSLLIFNSGDMRELGVDDFREREKASKFAESVAPLNLVPMLRGLKSSDPEIRLRSQRVKHAALQRTEALREVWSIAVACPDAIRLLYGGGELWLNVEDLRILHEGGYWLHRAITFVARYNGVEKEDECCPCRQPGYDFDDMHGYVNVMRFRIRGKALP